MKRYIPIEIDIPNPCTQSWDEMAPQGQGRYCDSCRKIVIDFSTWSDTELFNFFTKNTGPVCGRYLESQLRRPIHIPYQPHSRLYRMAIAMGLTLMFVHQPEVRGQSKAPIAAVDSLLRPESRTREINSAIVEIRGVVTENKREPLVNATVAIYQNGVVKGATVTDFDGNYSIRGLDSGLYDVTVSYIGYKANKMSRVPVSGTTMLNFIMETGGRMMGDMVIREYSYPLIDKYKHSTIIRPRW